MAVTLRQLNSIYDRDHKVFFVLFLFFPLGSVCACVRACVRVCVRACVCVWGQGGRGEVGTLFMVSLKLGVILN